MFKEIKNTFRGVGKLKIQPTKEGENFREFSSAKNKDWKSIMINFTLGEYDIPLFIKEQSIMKLFKLDEDGKLLLLNDNTYVIEDVLPDMDIDGSKYLIRDKRYFGSSREVTEFPHPYKWAKTVLNNLSTLDKGIVEVEGDIEYDYYNGHAIKKYKINKIVLVSPKTKQEFCLEETVAYKSNEIEGNIIPYYFLHNLKYKVGAEYVLVKHKNLSINSDTYSDGLFKGLDIAPMYLESLKEVEQGFIRVNTRLSKPTQEGNEGEFSVENLDPVTRVMFEKSDEKLQKIILERFKNMSSISTQKTNSQFTEEIILFSINEDKSIVDEIKPNSFKVAEVSAIERELKKKRNNNKYNITITSILGGEAEGMDMFVAPSYDEIIHEPIAPNTTKKETPKSPSIDIAETLGDIVPPKVETPTKDAVEKEKAVVDVVEDEDEFDFDLNF